MRARGRTYLLLTSVALLIAAFAQGDALGVPDEEVKVEVASVGIDRLSGAHYVLLEDKGKARGLPILIGDNEYLAILLVLHGVEPPRPLTHDLLRSIIEKTGNHVDRVLVSDLKHEVYYAKIYLDHGRYTIDSRPSDAIALAVRVNAPIYVAAKLLGPSTGLGLMEGVRLPHTARGLGLTVQNITPALASYFGLSSENGVLVSEVGRRARQAGLKQGDIVLKVGPHQIAALEDFVASVKAIKHGAQVVLTIRREGSNHVLALKKEP